MKSLGIMGGHGAFSKMVAMNGLRYDKYIDNSAYLDERKSSREDRSKYLPLVNNILDLTIEFICNSKSHKCRMVCKDFCNKVSYGYNYHKFDGFTKSIRSRVGKRMKDLMGYEIKEMYEQIRRDIHPEYDNYWPLEFKSNYIAEGNEEIVYIRIAKIILKTLWI